MRVKRVSLTNFRNYQVSAAELSPGRNILIGENAQGKTNFLEAIELAATGKSLRAQSDLDLIRTGADFMRLEIVIEARGTEETLGIAFRIAAADARRAIEKQISINGLTHSMMRVLRGRLVAVSFKSQDLYLLRGGPKYRREWIDIIAETLRPAFRDVAGKYQKVVTQRNRLLKALFEKGRMSGTDQDQLKVWDQQLAKFGAGVIHQRMTLLAELLPKAERFQEHISGQRETLTAEYIFSGTQTDDGEADDDLSQREPEPPQQLNLTMPHANNGVMDEITIAKKLMQGLRERRSEEIARKQTLVGPHRDDIKFCLNNASAVDFASQGQQRSLVLSLKLSELERVTESLTEPPILLLDDVLAELDLNRQGLLMSLVDDKMQTLITTTHVDGFKPEWLDGALFLKVENGSIKESIDNRSAGILAGIDYQ
jgi:DNA replication and repair protein RecF